MSDAARFDAAMTEPSMNRQVVVVTGASGLIGAGIAAAFYSAGATVVAHYRSSAGPVEQFVQAAVESGRDALAVQADLTDPDAAAGVIDAAAHAFGRVDVLVNNAGIQPVQPLESMTALQWRQMIDVNLNATFYISQAAARIMSEQGSGCVISIASIEAQQPAHDHAHYNVAKAAVVMHMRASALAYGKYGVRFNSVSPGLIGGPDLPQQWPDGVRRWQAAAPLGRTGVPADVAEACVFLASDKASWITGENLVVDGGVSIHPTY